MPIANKIMVNGNFDGCHRGHQSVFHYLKQKAKLLQLEPLIISYQPNTHFFRQGTFPLLSTSAEKIHYIKNLDFDYKLLTFDENLRKIPWQSFISDILVAELGVKYWIMGSEHKFGAKAQGNYENAVEFSKNVGLEIEQIPDLNNGLEKISSSTIRQLLKEGDILAANNLLGYEYNLRGTVMSGDKLGRTINFPTINLHIDQEKLIPAMGVYIAYCKLNDGRIFESVVNIGKRPTINGQNIRIEAHLLGFSENIYGQIVDLKLNLRLRNEKKFESLQQLAIQIGEDVESAKKIFNRNRRND